ncbi:hypothetical protein N7454_001178 [Penicillium verhagenii]|nr:hypothetical protein N7454_001178 [Penicillium verhagenii]
MGQNTHRFEDALKDCGELVVIGLEATAPNTRKASRAHRSAKKTSIQIPKGSLTSRCIHLYTNPDNWLPKSTAYIAPTWTTSYVPQAWGGEGKILASVTDT